MAVRLSFAYFLLAMLSFADAIAEQELRAARVETLPTVDGKADDDAWTKATGISTRDPIADIDISLKAVHDGERIALLVRYPDASEDREHKTMIWDSEREIYVTGPKREDIVVFKWSMEPIPVDLTLSSETPYKADIWYWKAHRTDHAGYADDKHQLYINDPLPTARRMLSKTGNLFYLTRSGDEGQAAYKAMVHPHHIGAEAPRFELQTPGGSRADVEAKGQWENGLWTIELSRRLDTGHSDDVTFHPTRGYWFGVSRFEMAGRRIDPRLEQPAFGCGEMGEQIELRFD